MFATSKLMKVGYASAKPLDSGRKAALKRIGQTLTQVIGTPAIVNSLAGETKKPAGRARSAARFIQDVAREVAETAAKKESRQPALQA